MAMAPAPDLTPAERRVTRDRRRRRIPPLAILLGGGRRRRPRRRPEAQRPYCPDRFSSRLFVAVALVIGLSLTDALLTLVLIARGATEVNPVMAYWLSHGPGVFVGVKYLLTCLPLTILLVCHDKVLGIGGTRVHHLFPLFIGLFATVVGWQIFLIMGRTG
jgi:hypothetical protein